MHILVAGRDAPTDGFATQEQQDYAVTCVWVDASPGAQRDSLGRGEGRKERVLVTGMGLHER